MNMTAYSQGKWKLLIPSGTSNQMVSLYFLDELNGWSVGQYGTITKSTDATAEVLSIDVEKSIFNIIIKLSLFLINFI